MIVGRNYKLDSNRNDLTLRPDGNTSGSVLKGYIHGDNIANFSFKLESSATNVFQFKHNASGLYLTVSGSSVVLLARDTGNTLQNFAFEGLDTSCKIRSALDWDKHFTIAADTDPTTLTLTPVNDGNQNNLFTFAEISNAQLGAPTPDKVFKHMNTVTVTGVLNGASVRLYSNGFGYEPQTAAGTSIVMNLPALQIGDELQFDQTKDGVTSAKSAIIKVNRAATVWQKGAKFQPTELLVTDSTGDDPDEWEGDEGVALGGLYDNYNDAVTYINSLGLASKTYTRS